jgi:hypothetical protein
MCSLSDYDGNKIEIGSGKITGIIPNIWKLNTGLVNSP